VGRQVGPARADGNGREKLESVLTFWLNGFLALGAAAAFLFKNYPLALMLSLLDVNFAIWTVIDKLESWK
jgi:hypothetical protein